MASAPDFVARAGAYIDRAHRVAGFLLICTVTLSILSYCQWQTNANLNQQLQEFTLRQPVIVVPGAVPGKYDPTEDRQLVMIFTDFITQAFNTFTPITLAQQIQTIQPFLAPGLLVDSQPYFEKKLADATSVKRSSLFIPDRNTLTIRGYQENGLELRDVSVSGILKNMAAGTLAEDVPLQITMTFRKTIINPTINPYGFELLRYHEKPILTPEEEARIDTSGPTPVSQPAPMQQQGL